MFGETKTLICGDVSSKITNVKRISGVFDKCFIHSKVLLADIEY